MDQQLKKELKAKAKEIKAKGCPGYINLSIASVEELQNYISKWENWSPEEPVEEIDLETPVTAADFTAINNAKTLSELGRAIAALAGTGDWKDWEMSLWTKNGECRVYMKDCSYMNPKDRGYYLIKENGGIEIFSPHKLPTLPPLPAVTNDLTASSNLSAEDKAIRKLNLQFGVNGWGQRDLEDELEREEYQ